MFQFEDCKVETISIMSNKSIGTFIYIKSDDGRDFCDIMRSFDKSDYDYLVRVLSDSDDETWNDVIERIQIYFKH